LSLRRESVDLGAVVHEALETCRPLLDRACQDLEITLPPEPVMVHGDPIRLAQVVANLVNNACKFTVPGGRIGMHVAMVDDQAVLRVADDGIGIPSHMLESIFERFTQVDRSLARNHDGLGIGLTLVKRVVELHGGRVEAHSAGVGRGSEFVVWLPALQPVHHQPAAPVSAHRAAGGGGKDVLVVDDNRDSAESLAMLLRLHGYHVAVAFDGLAALDAAEHGRPDAVVLDIGLPKRDGLPPPARPAMGAADGGRRAHRVGTGRRPVPVGGGRLRRPPGQTGGSYRADRVAG
jgi:CheY-like chemotaxis protein